VKFPGSRNQNQNGQRENSANQSQNNAVKNYFQFCEPDGHTEDICFLMESIEIKLKTVKSRIIEVQEYADSPSKNSTSSKN
jgi:hypothetical protein